MRRSSLLLVILSLVLITYLIWPETVITYPPGILVPEQPEQILLEGNEGIIKDGYLVNKLAVYKIHARILSIERYYFDKESSISPMDLALGWGPMSDQKILDEIEISQSRRWYHWQSSNLPIPRDEINKNSANVHIIPSDYLVEEKLEELYVGNVIYMQGFLAKVIGPDGFKWSSSLSRNDTGNGACELFFVESIQIEKKE